MRFNDFPFLRYVLFLVLGILSYRALTFGAVPYLFGVIGGLWGFYLVLLMAIGRRKVFRPKWCFAVIAYLLLYLSGYFLAYQKNASNHAEHILYKDVIMGYMAEVLEVDETKPNSFANRVAIKKVKTAEGISEASGEVLIYHQLDSALQMGEILWIPGAPQSISAPRNPKEFDYRRYLANKQIYHSHFVGEKIYRLGVLPRPSIRRTVSRLRERVSRKIDLYIKDDKARQVAKAFIIGKKQQLDQEVSEAYVKAGTMHILAVSGLHVGMICGFFFLFFKPYRLSVGKKVLFLSCVVLLIWLYAIMTGLSPSVMRAATMFSILAVAQMKSRSPSILNSLALSAVVLMVFNPYVIYEVGFQLSYAAVLGIVILQPLLVSAWLPKNRFLYYLWEITSVSIAAQLATFPITSYYFHVFPNYGLLANLVAIPGAFLVMAVGLPFMMLSIFDVFVSPVAYLMGHLIQALNYLIFQFQALPFAQTKGIYIEAIGMLLFWGFLASFYHLITSRRKRYALSLMVILMLAVVANAIRRFVNREYKVLYVYALDQGFALDYFQEGKLFTTQSELSEQDFGYYVRPNQASLMPYVSFPLAWQNRDSVLWIYLPNERCIMKRGQLLDISSLEVRELAFFEEGDWQKSEETDSLVQINRAVKIILR